MPPAARMTDMTTGHACFPPTIIAMGSPTVFINALPAARVTDMIVPHVCPPVVHAAPIALGSSTVFINALPAARIGDMIGCTDIIALGSFNTIIGG